jgi:hypothetical protein
LRRRRKGKPERTAEGETFCAIALEPVERAVKPTISHSIARKDSKLIEAVGTAGRASSPTSSSTSSGGSSSGGPFSADQRADAHKRLKILLLRRE